MDPRGLEATYIRDSHAALMRHIAYRKHSFWLPAGAIAIGLAGASLGVIVVMTICGDAYDMIYASVFSDTPVPSASVDWMLAGTAGMFLFPIVAWLASLKMAASFWPVLAEYVGRNSIQFTLDEDDTAEKLANRARYRIEGAMRRGMVGAGRPFDPAAFLRQEAKRVRWRWLAAAIVLMLFCIGCFLRATSP